MNRLSSRVVTQLNLSNGGTVVYSHDANGNVTQNDGETIDYNAFNKPQRIDAVSGSAYAEFTYGADLMRYRQEKDTGAIIYYLDKHMEIESIGSSVDYRHYLGDIAVLTKTGSLNDSNPSIDYLFRDRLGGVSAVGSNQTAFLFENRAYDPYGRPRNGDWSDKTPEPIIGSNVTDRGFTDHEHLDDWQLIHMNGRGFDYNAGRFLSVDPFIQDPGNSQSINGFAYIMNNPLSGTDPSGYAARIGGSFSYQGFIGRRTTQTQAGYWQENRRPVQPQGKLAHNGKLDRVLSPEHHGMVAMDGVGNTIDSIGEPGQNAWDLEGSSSGFPFGPNTVASDNPMEAYSADSPACPPGQCCALGSFSSTDPDVNSSISAAGFGMTVGGKLLSEMADGAATVSEADAFRFTTMHKAGASISEMQPFRMSYNASRETTQRVADVAEGTRIAGDFLVVAGFGMTAYDIDQGNAGFSKVSMEILVFASWYAGPGVGAAVTGFYMAMDVSGVANEVSLMIDSKVGQAMRGVD